MSEHRREDGSTCTTWTNKSSSLAPEWGGDGTGPSPFYTQDDVFASSPVTGTWHVFYWPVNAPEGGGACMHG